MSRNKWLHREVGLEREGVAVYIHGYGLHIIISLHKITRLIIGIFLLSSCWRTHQYLLLIALNKPHARPLGARLTLRARAIQQQFLLLEAPEEFVFFFWIFLAGGSFWGGGLGTASRIQHPHALQILISRRRHPCPRSSATPLQVLLGDVGLFIER